MPANPDRTKDYQTQQADDFLAHNVKESCLSCENFSKRTCPAFNSAVSEQNIDEQVLRNRIQEAQENMQLIPCVNAPDNE